MTHSNTDPIVAVEALSARFPLPEPLLIGEFRIDSRDYVFVRVRTNDGLVGKAYALSNGLPMQEIVNGALRRELLGKDAREIRARWEDCFRGTVAAGRAGLVMCALSLTDIALWDIAAQRADLPLWQLLGGFRRQLPVLMVAGYLTQNRSPEEVGSELVDYAKAGNRFLKIARSPDPLATRRLLEIVGAGLPEGSRVVIDGLWGWRSVREALEEVDAWQLDKGLGDKLGWLEDPFPPENVLLYRQLRERCDLKIGAGDDLTDRHVAHALIDAEALDVIRLDPLALGGVTPSIGVIEVAAAKNCEFSPHVYPEVNIHLAAAFPGCVAVEMFDPSGNRLEMSHRFVTGGPKVEGGVVHAPEGPGLGFDIDWELVAAQGGEAP